MTTKLITIDTDTHVVVPREPNDEMVNASWMCQGVTSFDSDGIQKAISIAWHAMVKKAPQLTTPPVLRWEGCELLVGDVPLAQIGQRKDNKFYVHTIGRWAMHAETEQEARRAAEKALGFPDWLVVDEL